MRRDLFEYTKMIPCTSHLVPAKWHHINRPLSKQDDIVKTGAEIKALLSKLFSGVYVFGDGRGVIENNNIHSKLVLTKLEEVIRTGSLNYHPKPREHSAYSEFIIR